MPLKSRHLIDLSHLLKQDLSFLTFQGSEHCAILIYLKIAMALPDASEALLFFQDTDPV